METEGSFVIKGGIPEAVKNTENLYEGNLKHYFKTVFFQARNVNNGYHNFRHMMHVFWLCYLACIYYRSELSPRRMRNLLIAAMFHDFNHSGKKEPDRKQIQRATDSFLMNVLEEDNESIADILTFIRLSEYPYQLPSVSSMIELEVQILRDADLSQALNVAWIQQVIFGLAEEWGKEPIEILETQEKFLSDLKFSTDWARRMFRPLDVQQKIQEAKELLDILKE
jgi:hypothetical protein